MKALYKAYDYIREVAGVPVQWVDPLLRPDSVSKINLLATEIIENKNLPDDTAYRLHEIRPEVPVADFEKQIRNPIASRAIAIWVDLEIPALGKRLVLDTRVDNPLGVPPTISAISSNNTNYPWPADPMEKSGQQEGPTTKGHGGSSCPGYLSKAIENNSATGGMLDIPVEVLAFHCEGEHQEGRYSISMYSEVLGRVSAQRERDKVDLNMWGKMLITFEPKYPGEFRGHTVIQLVSDDYVRQTGTVTGFPPHFPGEYVESKGNERYVGLNIGQRHLEAFVKQGRIIFSTDVDDFLQARTRVSHFELLDQQGDVINLPGPPYVVDDFSIISGVKISWQDVRPFHSDVKYYVIYRMDPDFPKDFKFLARVKGNTYVDSDYNGRRSLAYAVVPAFIDQTGMEVQGVSLDHAMVMALEPEKSAFKNRNHGVGHVRYI